VVEVLQKSVLRSTLESFIREKTNEQFSLLLDEFCSIKRQSKVQSQHTDQHLEDIETSTQQIKSSYDSSNETNLRKLQAISDAIKLLNEKSRTQKNPISPNKDCPWNAFEMEVQKSVTKSKSLIIGDSIVRGMRRDGIHLSIPADNVDRRLDTRRQPNDRISPANNNARDVFRNNTIRQHHYGGPPFAETINRGPRVYSVDETSKDAPHRQHNAEVPPRPNQDGDVYWNRYPRRQHYYGPPLPGSPRGDFRARGPQRLHHYGTYIGSNPNDDPWTRGPRYKHYRGAPSTGFHDDVNGFRDQRRQPYRPTGENRHLDQNGNGRKWHY